MTLPQLCTHLPSLSSLNRWIIVIAVGLAASVLQERVAAALTDEDATLAQSGHSDDEIAADDDVVRRFGKASEPGLREMVANALVSKGAALGQLGRRKEAIAVYDDVIDRFGKAEETALREWVAKARKNRSSILQR